MSAWIATLYTIEWANVPKPVQTQDGQVFHSWLNPSPRMIKEDQRIQKD
jgi:hypothetical protein